ncbi:MAG: DUF2490 domain-containing protein [Candidatus Omnitrophica bacterium]|nr:DUF2490 domain-containing protein [Candidatus Omnitrophota bacterium]
MKKVIFVIIGLSLALAAKTYAYDDHDFQIWNTDSEEYKINKESKIVLEQEFRWGDNASEFFYQHYDIGYFHDLKKWFNVGGGYRQIFELYRSKWQQVNEPYVTMTFSGDVKGFKLSNRSRMEFNDYEHKRDFWRYRNKTDLKLPWKFTKIEIQPYVSDEVFLTFGGLPTQFSQNRFCAGFTMNLTKNLKADIYYMLQSVKGTDVWLDANVLGTKIKLSF